MAKKTKDETAFKQCECEKIFAFVKDQKTNKIKIVVGNYNVSTKEFDNFDDAEKYVKSKPYELMVNTSCLFMHFSNEQKQENNEKTEKV